MLSSHAYIALRAPRMPVSNTDLLARLSHKSSTIPSLVLFLFFSSLKSHAMPIDRVDGRCTYVSALLSAYYTPYYQRWHA